MVTSLLTLKYPKNSKKAQPISPFISLYTIFICKHSTDRAIFGWRPPSLSFLLLLPLVVFSVLDCIALHLYLFKNHVVLPCFCYDTLKTTRPLLSFCLLILLSSFKEENLAFTTLLINGYGCFLREKVEDTKTLETKQKHKPGSRREASWRCRSWRGSPDGPAWRGR